MTWTEATILGATFAGLCLTGLATIFALRGRRDLTRPLPPQRFRAVTWDGEVCIWAFLLLFVSQAVAALVVRGSPAFRLAVASGLLIVELPLVFWLLGGLPYRPSISCRRMREDAALAFITWLVVTPVTLVVFLSAVYIVRQWGDLPREHNLILMLKDSAPWWLWVVVGFEAVVAAPIREEVFFRGVLQPWAMRRSWGGDLLFALALVAGFVFRESPSVMVRLVPSLFVVLVLIACLAVNWRLPPRPLPIGWHAPWRVIIGGALLFAMVHGGAWPAPIPLALLGVALGWLAFRTQGLVAPLVCHSLFNGLTIVSQFILLHQPAQ